MLHTDEKPLELEVEKTNTTISETTNEIKEKQNELTQAVETFEEEEMSLLSDLKKKTDKDLDGSTSTTDTKEVTNADGSKTIVTTESTKRTNVIYQNHEIVAQMTVAALNVAMGLILQLISDDWSEEAEKKYSLSPTRKKEILDPLTILLEQRRGKYNPVVILVITVLVAYVPMFISAFRTRKEKMKLAKSKKKYIASAGDNAEIIDEQEKIKEEINNVGKNEVKQVERVEIFKMTKGQNDRLKKIKSKRGARSEADKQFIKDMGLEGLV